MNLKKILFVISGCISLGIGVVGAVLPILPSVPFLMVAAFCFAKSSKRLHTWFIGTKIYKNNLESLVEGKGMIKDENQDNINGYNTYGNWFCYDE